MDLALYKRENPCYNLSCSGPVVQSVSTPACHAGGRRFESVPGRQKIVILWDGYFFVPGKGLEQLSFIVKYAPTWALNRFPPPHNGSYPGKI